MAQSTLTARVDSSDKECFDQFCKVIGLTSSSVINLFVKKVIAEGKIPFEIAIPQNTSLDAGRNSFYSLRNNANNLMVQELTLDEINAEIEAARSSKI